MVRLFFSRKIFSSARADPGTATAPTNASKSQRRPVFMCSSCARLLDGIRRDLVTHQSGVLEGVRDVGAVVFVVVRVRAVLVNVVERVRGRQLHDASLVEDDSPIDAARAV